MTNRPVSSVWKGISRNTFVLGLVSLFNDISSDMIQPLLPKFLKSVIGASVGSIGLIEGIAQSVASIVKPLSGWLSDRASVRKPAVTLGYWISACARPLLSVSTATSHVLGVRFADRIGKGTRTAARDALIADSSAVEYRGKAYGFHRALDNLGAVLGMLGAALILRFLTGSLRAVFWIAAIPGLIALALVIWGIKEEPVRKAARRQSPSPRPGGLPLRRQLIKWYVVVFVFWLGNSADAFLILKADLAGLAVWQLPLLMLATSAVATIFSTPMGALSDRVGRRPLIAVGWAYYAIVYAAFAFAERALCFWRYLLRMVFFTR